MDHCPICNKQFRTTTDYLDGHTLLEEYGGCPERHYGYSFSYGYYEEQIGHTPFFWSYRETAEARRKRLFWRALRVKWERLKWRVSGL